MVTGRGGGGGGGGEGGTFEGDGLTYQRVRSLTVAAVPRSATRLREFRRAYHWVMEARRSIVGMLKLQFHNFFVGKR